MLDCNVLMHKIINTSKGRRRKFFTFVTNNPTSIYIKKLKTLLEKQKGQ